MPGGNVQTDAWVAGQAPKEALLTIAPLPCRRICCRCNSATTPALLKGSVKPAKLGNRPVYHLLYLRVVAHLLRALDRLPSSCFCSAMCVMGVVAAAPGQCFCPGGMRITSPG